LPEVAGFKDDSSAKTFCCLGAGVISYSLLTKARWGIYPLLPFRKHLLLDIAVSLFALSAPWLLGFSKNKKARNTLIGVGAAGLAAAVLTDQVEHTEQENLYLFI
jgi:hypothetical protein